MRVKGKRVLKNGTIAGYVYYPKEKKWKWRFLGKQHGGGKTKTARELLDEYSHLTSEIENFVNYLDQRPSKKKESKEARKILKEKFNKIKGLFNKQFYLRHKKRQIRRNGTRGTYLDVTYDRINVLLSYAILLKEYNKQKEQDQFRNTIKSDPLKLFVKTFHGHKYDNDTSTKLINDIYIYICKYLEETNERWIEKIKKIKNEDLKKYSFVSDIKEKCMKKKFASIKASINTLLEIAEKHSNAAEANLEKVKRKLQIERNRLSTTAKASTANLGNNSNANIQIQGVFNELGIQTGNTESTGHTGSTGNTRPNGNAGPHYTHKQVKQLLNEANANGNTGATHKNVRRYAGPNTANAVRRIEEEHHNTNQNLEQALSNFNRINKTFQEAFKRLNSNQ